MDRQIILSPKAMFNETMEIIAQQQRTVSGTVTDSRQQPLPGVTVIVKGTTTGTITNFNGLYSIPNVPETATLVFSFVGMRMQEVVVGNQTSINVTLEDETFGIEEVVAIGYGTARRSDLTGAVASVQGESLQKRSTQQLSTAMQGQMAGVQVTRNSGAPGASATVRIRGITTLSNNDPLVIVDGVPSSLNDVIAADVETMTVLKDAASASIYGSRAAAGVILITTKRAKENQFIFDYNYQYSMDRPTAKPTNGDVIDWMNVQNEVKWNDGASSPYSQYSQETINSWLTNNATDPWHYPNTDWVDLILKKSTSNEQHMLSVS
jgi:TonB-linked SusC/RagA family outer membrane protein